MTNDKWSLSGEVNLCPEECAESSEHCLGTLWIRSQLTSGDSAVVSPDQPCHPPTRSVRQSMCFAQYNPLIQPPLYHRERARERQHDCMRREMSLGLNDSPLSLWMICWLKLNTQWREARECVKQIHCSPFTNPRLCVIIQPFYFTNIQTIFKMHAAGAEKYWFITFGNRETHNELWIHCFLYNVYWIFTENFIV